jgi:hypothetical protein
LRGNQQEEGGEPKDGGVGGINGAGKGHSLLRCQHEIDVARNRGHWDAAMEAARQHRKEEEEEEEVGIVHLLLSLVKRKQIPFLISRPMDGLTYLQLPF